MKQKTEPAHRQRIRYDALEQDTVILFRQANLMAPESERPDPLLADEAPGFVAMTDFG